MRWFQGGIAEAVAASKARNAIFVVFVEGWFDVLLQLERVTPMSIIECHLSWNRWRRTGWRVGDVEHSAFVFSRIFGQNKN